MAGISDSALFNVSSRNDRTLENLRAAAFRNLASNEETQMTDRIALDMDIVENVSFAPNMTFSDQLVSARKTLSSIYEDTFAVEQDSADMTLNFTDAHLRLFLDDDPGWKASEALFNDFLRCLLMYPGPNEVFELLRQFENLCSDQIAILRKIIERGVPGEQKFVRTAEMLRFIQSELWTWRLIRMMYEDRSNKDRAAKLSNVTEDQVRLMTDLEKWNFLFICDRQFREMRLVLKWCQANAADIFDVQSRANFFEGKSYIWEDTLHKLKTESYPTRKLIQHMDPDAPIRENARLEDSDEANEKRLLTLVFCWIRAGRLDKAIDLCVQCGQEWRAALLSNALIYHNDESLEKPATGSTARDVWKRMAWQFCEDPSLPETEKAIYGSLSGHFSSIIILCQSWEDSLWAHSIAASEQAFDEFLRNTSYGKRKVAELFRSSPANIRANGLMLDEILHELETSDNEKIALGSKGIFQRLQSFILLDQPDQAVLYLNQYLNEHGNEISAHLVRFMAHVVLIFNLCSLEIPVAFADGIIEHYVKILIAEQRNDLVAYYTSVLEPNLQRKLYAEFLQNIEDKGQRLHYLSLAEKAGMNGPFICSAVMENIKSSYEPIVKGERLSSSTYASFAINGIDDMTNVVNAMTADITEQDMRLIGAIEWLLFYPVLHGETVRQANFIARLFLIGRNVPAAMKLFDSMPADILKTATEAWQRSDDEDAQMQELSVEYQNTIREFLCHQAYLKCHHAFSRWFEHFHSKKPLPALVEDTETGMSSAATFRRRTLREAKQKQYEESLAVWERDQEILAEAACQAAYNVLLYPDGGWMVDDANDTNVTEGLVEPERQQELIALRQKCIPLVMDMLIKVLESRGRYRDAMQVADVIASEETSLYQVFTKDQLKQLVKRMANISADTLNIGTDCLGYK